jgi:3-phenylpropionate/cinnamic acid dioxygenase small subunit
MDLIKTKRKLIEAIESTEDENLLMELLDRVEQRDIISLSNEQKAILQERIMRVEEGKATYSNAHDEADKIKKKLDEL